MKPLISKIFNRYVVGALAILCSTIALAGGMGSPAAAPGFFWPTALGIGAVGAVMIGAAIANDHDDDDDGTVVS